MSTSPDTTSASSLPFTLSGLAAGLLFGAGLAVAGMTQPAKVVGFLDVTGQWDPSLAFVMGGAIAVHLVLFRLILRRPSPLLREAFSLPTSRHVDRRLLVGAALFGLGWGLGGYCPGPGVVSLVAGAREGILFVGSMVAGMLLFHIASRALSRTSAGSGLDVEARPDTRRLGDRLPRLGGRA